MGRVVGTAGETSIRIVVRPNTNKFITAYLVKIDGGNSNGII
ncbi:hypothetical protein [Bacillus mycoides]|nr:hypothetical protein [Bacillus mycoides]